MNICLDYIKKYIFYSMPSSGVFRMGAIALGSTFLGEAYLTKSFK